jgi:FKBP-type peptidyl-prolyl cis-trans isomerase
VVKQKKQADAFKEKAAKGKAQMEADEKELKAYFAKNKISATKHASGLYYKMSKVGTDDTARAGDSVVVNYTGKTLDGKTFDSNVDTAFHHPQPFSFRLAQGQVIPGWDIGVGIMKKGSKATLYIPSPMAYGERSPGPEIPKNAILIFDVEVLNIYKIKASK